MLTISLLNNNKLQFNKLSVIIATLSMNKIKVAVSDLELNYSNLSI